MVTPRGYANKYDLDDGCNTRSGEKPCRSTTSRPCLPHRPRKKAPRPRRSRRRRNDRGAQAEDRRLQAPPAGLHRTALQPRGASQDLFDSLGDKFKAAGLHEGALRVKRSRVGCFAACKGGPVMCVQPDGTWYYNVTPENMDRILSQHLVGGMVVEDLVFHQGPGLAPDGDT